MTWQECNEHTCCIQRTLLERATCTCLTANLCLWHTTLPPLASVRASRWFNLSIRSSSVPHSLTPSVSVSSPNRLSELTTPNPAADIYVLLNARLRRKIYIPCTPLARYPSAPSPPAPAPACYAICVPAPKLGCFSRYGNGPASLARLTVARTEIRLWVEMLTYLGTVS